MLSGTLSGFPKSAERSMHSFGCGISLAPAVLASVGVCGTRLIWIFTVFPSHQTFGWIMTSYPVSLALTAIMMFVCLLLKHPSPNNV